VVETLFTTFVVPVVMPVTHSAESAGLGAMTADRPTTLTVVASHVCKEIDVK
jgi:hypothetical protein